MSSEFDSKLNAVSTATAMGLPSWSMTVRVKASDMNPAPALVGPVRTKLDGARRNLGNRERHGYPHGIIEGIGANDRDRRRIDAGVETCNIDRNSMMMGSSSGGRSDVQPGRIVRNGVIKGAASGIQDRQDLNCRVHAYGRSERYRGGSHGYLGQAD